ncbi:MAG: glycosyltransferase family 2 protein [Fimbriimonadaceae bacterium]
MAYVPDAEAANARTLPYTGDLAASAAAFQRVSFFRPWYADRRVLDITPGDRSGANYASFLARSIAARATKPEIDPYPGVPCTRQTDLKTFDLIVALDPSEAPVAIAEAAAYRSAVARESKDNPPPHEPIWVVAIPGPMSGKPADATAIREEAETSLKPVRWLSQVGRWPGHLAPGLSPDATVWIAVTGDWPLPEWPTVGLSIPTHNGADNVADAVTSLVSTYPGPVHLAVVANGCDDANLRSLRELASGLPDCVTLIELTENEGFARGVNAGLRALIEDGRCDVIGTCNDDIVAGIDCLPEMVAALAELDQMGYRPGVIGPVSDRISGSQKIDVGPVGTLQELDAAIDSYRRLKAGTVTPVRQLRGLFMLFHPHLVRDVGGFDPIFGIGNCEDDDHNLRTHLAGYTLWQADGAFVHHKGSQTFGRLSVDYAALIEHNCRLFEQKWGVPLERFPSVTEAPSGVDLCIPLLETDPFDGQGRKVGTATPAATPTTPASVESADPMDLTTEEFGRWVAEQVRNEGDGLKRRVIEAVESHRRSEAA